MNVSLFLNACFLALVSLSFFISLLVLIIILIRLRLPRSNVSLLLTCNTYVTITIFCCTLLDIGLHSLNGYLNLSLSYANRWCRIRSYFSHVFFCSFYYSFVVQAVFRLFRVIFYRKKSLHSPSVFIVAIALQWILSFLVLIPNFLFDDFQYQPLEYSCWISFRNIRGLLLATLIIYAIPLVVIIFSIYAFLLEYLRRSQWLSTTRPTEKSESTKHHRLETIAHSSGISHSHWCSHSHGIRRLSTDRLLNSLGLSYSIAQYLHRSGDHLTDSSACYA